MTEREEFEAHFGGRYLGLQQDIAWAAWQAATAAERERCIDLVAMFGGSVEIEAAIRRGS